MNGSWQCRGVPEALRYRYGGSREFNQLKVEVFVPRQLLSTVEWVSPTSGNWNPRSNRNTGTVPGPNDDVVINPSAALTVTIDSGNQSVNSLQGGSNATL
jgi:hypothetical protein